MIIHLSDDYESFDCPRSESYPGHTVCRGTNRRRARGTEKVRPGNRQTREHRIGIRVLSTNACLTELSYFIYSRMQAPMYQRTVQDSEWERQTLRLELEYGKLLSRVNSAKRWARSAHLHEIKVLRERQRWCQKGDGYSRVGRTRVGKPTPRLVLLRVLIASESERKVMSNSPERNAFA